MSDSTDDLEPLVADLAETLSALERRIDEEPSRRRAFLRFTEEYAIPTTVAVLEANIRLLEAVGGAIRIAEGRESERRGTGSRDAALSALDRTLSEVTDAVRGTPTDPDARRLLEEARDLRAEIDDRVAGRRRDDRSTSSPSPSRPSRSRMPATRRTRTTARRSTWTPSSTPSGARCTVTTRTTRRDGGPYSTGSNR
jgi:hypothetical protein